MNVRNAMLACVIIILLATLVWQWHGLATDPPVDMEVLIKQHSTEPTLTNTPFGTRKPNRRLGDLKYGDPPAYGYIYIHASSGRLYLFPTREEAFISWVDFNTLLSKIYRDQSGRLVAELSRERRAQLKNFDVWALITDSEIELYGAVPVWIAQPAIGSGALKDKETLGK